MDVIEILGPHEMGERSDTWHWKMEKRVAAAATLMKVLEPRKKRQCRSVEMALRERVGGPVEQEWETRSW